MSTHRLLSCLVGPACGDRCCHGFIKWQLMGPSNVKEMAFFFTLVPFLSFLCGGNGTELEWGWNGDGMGMGLEREWNGDGTEMERRWNVDWARIYK